MPLYYPENNTAASTDGELRCLNKLVSLGATGITGVVLHGVGDPNGVVAGTAYQTFYVQEDNHGVVWVNVDGATAWAINA